MNKQTTTECTECGGSGKEIQSKVIKNAIIVSILDITKIEKPLGIHISTLAKDIEQIILFYLKADGGVMHLQSFENRCLEAINQ